jgi:hypothetical protein
MDEQAQTVLNIRNLLEWLMEWLRGEEADARLFFDHFDQAWPKIDIALHHLQNDPTFGQAENLKHLVTRNESTVCEIERTRLLSDRMILQALVINLREFLSILERL